MTIKLVLKKIVIANHFVNDKIVNENLYIYSLFPYISPL